MFSSNVQTRVEASSLAVVGAACRLPGASNEDSFWRLLDGGQSAMGPLPAGRWHPERYFHPRRTEAGFSYSFAGGYIADPMSFDPGVFGISPREAEEMDPQQRMLLETVWSALEDGGISPGSIAGTNVGVYVGASGLDHGNLHVADPGSIDSHFMTGNTLSILSNRISYIYDLRGPSFTVDTACSSSLVAFAQAQAAIASGQIDTAIVAGVNLLLSPFPFIGFSRASMLSPTGLCRPFSAEADGYVRGEGVVAMVLTRLETAISSGRRVRAVALASGVNSDGRTNGIALPATEGQKILLDRLYGHAGLDPNRLAFVEAHGTGTRVGDPAEATAIGQALGQRRDAPLPIGSVKSNIGHLEPASGLAGLFKAILALEHRRLPASLHLAAINPAIDFTELNLALATQSLALPASGTWLAGVSSFGFGGTNAHVVIRQPESSELPGHHSHDAQGQSAELLVLSAHSRQALRDTSRAYADLIDAGSDTAQLAAAVAWQRDLAGHRIALPVAEATPDALRGFADSGGLAGGADGVAPSQHPRTCFVYSGNGSQWVGMGRAAFARNEAFRERFRAVDASFARYADWSLVDALHDPDIANSKKQAELVQPLLFAVQSALTAGLAAYGWKPDMVLGHSVGEVAAAEACGALSLDEAVRVIFHRSSQQEAAHGLGGMAVANISRDGAEALFLEGGLHGLEIAAVNSPGSVSIAGPMDAIQAFSRLARKRRIAARVLELPYPFHSSLLEKLREPLLEAFGTIASQPGRATFVSTVTGAVTPGERLDTDYWWRNVRQPVLFSAAVETAGLQGATVFVEIGPRPILHSSIADTLAEAGFSGSVIPSLIERPADGDPLLRVLARAVVLGCAVDRPRVFGARPSGRVRLPPYAWQRKTYRQAQTSEAMDLMGDAPRHPLIGSRLLSGTPEWRNLIDATVVPYLAQHRIDGEIVLPATAFAEMALAVAREVFPAGPIGLEDFDLLQWLTLQPDQMREMSVRLHGDTATVEIWSRPRHGTIEWTLHARGRIVQVASPVPAFIPPVQLPKHLTTEQVYDAASASGVSYGKLFQRVLSGERSDTLMEVELSPYEEAAGLSGRRQILHPIALDAAFHAMFDNIKRRADERYAYLPVRFGALRVERDHAIPARARVVIDRETDQSLSVGVTLYDRDGQFIAGLTGGLFRAVVLEQRARDSVFFQSQPIRLSREASGVDLHAGVIATLEQLDAQTAPDSWLYLGAFARSLAFQSLRGLFGDSAIRPTAGIVAARSVPLLRSLLATLRHAGLATEAASGWTLAAESGLPDPHDILQTLAAEFSGASSELVLAAQALAGTDRMLRTGEAPQRNAGTTERFESSSILLVPVLDAALAICIDLQARIAPEPLRILVAESFCLGILQSLAPLVQDRRVTITVIGTDQKQLNLTAARHGAIAGITFLAADPDAAAAIGPSFDLALGLALGPLFAGDTALGRAIAHRLAPGAPLCILLPPENPVFECLLGMDEDWFAQSSGARSVVGRIAAAQDDGRMIGSAGFADVRTHRLGEEVGSIIVGKTKARDVSVAMAELAPVLLLQDWPDLGEALVTAGRTVVVCKGAGMAAIVSKASGMSELVFQAYGSGQGGLDRSIAELSSVLELVRTMQCRFWVVVRGLRSDRAADIDPLAEAFWSFVRVAINEYPGLEFRLVDLALELDVEDAVRRLVALMARPGEETELLLDATGISATRMVAAPPATEAVEAVRLQLGSHGAMASFGWVEAARRAPEAGEIEIEIAASGLNFRDVMLASGLLDDDVLDDGLAGAVFGFECAGHVLRVGQGVTHLKPGDAVMGFGRESFATHGTADSRVFTRVPDGIPTIAAASIPVAFLTAWYSLVHMAQIQPGEWVLIHGAAGGVGIAAMQIARLRGARIAATVSSPEKRALAAAFGAEKIYNSRSTAFLDEIRADIGGVDVVLNSLTGEAMLASLKCLKPFGRFIELGKRDYVQNTALGLRPFRRNLSYFGVDLDQLLAANLPLVERLLAELATHFGTGALSPLPHRAFEWHEVDRAFHLMQSAGHVGKLVVRPAARPVATRIAHMPFKPKSGVHLVVGGAGGFGFETAAWLAERGAETIVIASRRGVIEQPLQARAAAIRAGGTTLLVETLDVTDADAVAALIDRLTRTHRRLAGIIHAAMVLDDGMIAGMDPVRTRAVLAPKIDGAANLDRATRGTELDYFVAFSSITTMVGNPGQGAYVAANGYLQGLMAQRRAAGLAGLAVGWGAIADAGILARDTETAARLARLTGIEAMQSRAALAHLETLLSRTGECPATNYCALLRPGDALQSLKLLQTPAFANLFATDDGVAVIEVDLATRIAGKSAGDARALVAGLVAAEVARIFRLPPEEIEMARPLDELGLDSMMSLDLRMSIEKRFGIELPVVAITAGISVNDLAARLITSLRTGPQTEDDAGLRMMQQHGLDDASLAAGMIAIDKAVRQHDVAKVLL
ncbi:SDR family NAD(P)-dependent oxidoreductase [Lichenicola cladoniae]|uniref:SDR family NAD(P)-dependent oxidoreductase n=1 Tax=Lichenicola cladoniae TaxID=1484109 RepID=A0A6M8HR18_9PROT|nr:type I polyketide synthase [Lichenicola cladoniae]NPD68779.1 SDR family NAD(P)-dependent oxidoreductase [Acetobacteraceae bacterium]QKE90798.1 SDR family NAD(P)-dependent oxidoreductase [Lichenicola cladoniae]